MTKKLELYARQSSSFLTFNESTNPHNHPSRDA